VGRTDDASPGAIEPVELSGRGLLLRPWRRSDVDAIAAARRHPTIALWSPEGGGGDEGSVESWLSSQMDWSTGARASFAVVDPLSHRVAGGVRLHRIEAQRGEAEIGYWTVPAVWGRGVATRAVETATEWAFDNLRLRRVYLCHALDNPASCRVAQRAGFRLEGTLRASYRYGDGRLHDEHLHARLATDDDVSLDGKGVG
jgi:RimJ/RimL family protein N-acetyltransferase